MLSDGGSSSLPAQKVLPPLPRITPRKPKKPVSLAPRLQGQESRGGLPRPDSQPREGTSVPPGDVALGVGGSGPWHSLECLRQLSSLASDPSPS